MQELERERERESERERERETPNSQEYILFVLFQFAVILHVTPKIVFLAG